MFRFLSTCVDSSLELLFSPCCPICKIATFKVGVCDFCNPIHLIKGKVCERCGIPLDVNLRFCGECHEVKEAPLDAIRSALWFTEDARTLIHKVKFEKGYEWLEVFKKILIETQFPYLDEPFTLVPVPLHRTKFIKRGFNQSEILIEYLRQSRAYPASYDLKKIRETLPQSALGRFERMANLRGVFRWDSSKPVPRKVILIDDIVTTGETLNACARVFKKLGSEKVCAWTLFRSMR